MRHKLVHAICGTQYYFYSSFFVYLKIGHGLEWLYLLNSNYEDYQLLWKCLVHSRDLQKVNLIPHIYIFEIREIIWKIEKLEKKYIWN